MFDTKWSLLISTPQFLLSRLCNQPKNKTDLSSSQQPLPSSMAVSRAKVFPLLRLPLEIRVVIYKFALVTDAKCLRHPRELTNHASYCRKPYMKMFSRRNYVIKRAPPVLLRLNRQIYNETLQLFYALNNFQFKIHHLTPTWQAFYPTRTPLTSLLSDNPKQHMPLIKHLSLKYPEPEADLLTIPRDTLDKTFSWYIHQIRTLCPTLDTLTLHILCTHPNVWRTSDFRQLPHFRETREAIKAIRPHLKTFELICFGFSQSWEKLRFQIADPYEWEMKTYRDGCSTPDDVVGCQCQLAPSRTWCREHWRWDWPGVSIGWEDDDRFNGRNERFRNERFRRIEGRRLVGVGRSTVWVNAEDREWEEVRGFLLKGGRFEERKRDVRI